MPWQEEGKRTTGVQMPWQEEEKRTTGVQMPWRQEKKCAKGGCHKVFENSENLK